MDELADVIDMKERRRTIPPGPWSTRQLDAPFRNGFPRCEAVTEAGHRCKHAARRRVGDLLVCLMAHASVEESSGGGPPNTAA